MGFVQYLVPKVLLETLGSRTSMGLLLLDLILAAEWV